MLGLGLCFIAAWAHVLSSEERAEVHRAQMDQFRIERPTHQLISTLDPSGSQRV